MRKHLVFLLAMGIVLALAVAGAALGSTETVRVGNLILKDSGGISPSVLPRDRQAPVTGTIFGRLSTVDGTHPPAVRQVRIYLDKTIEVNARGLPACGLGQLEARSTADARRACPGAVVGEGVAAVEVAFPEQTPFTATGPIVVFNGGVHGGTTLLYIHTYVAVPAPTAVVAKVAMTHVHRGHFGLYAEARIPSIAGGAGSITRFKFQIHRSFTYGGRQVSYLTASCPTGHYYTEGEVQFDDSTRLHVFHPFTCTPSG
jgi:hypothetical protein